MTCEEKLKKLLAALDIVLQDNNLGKDWRVHPYAVFMDEEEAYLAARAAVLEAEDEK